MTDLEPDLSTLQIPKPREHYRFDIEIISDFKNQTMKKLKAQRAITQRLFLIGFAAIIALMCFAASPTIKAGFKSTGTTASIFAGVFGVTKIQEKDGAGEGNRSTGDDADSKAKDEFLGKVKKMMGDAMEEYSKKSKEEQKTYTDKIGELEKKSANITDPKEFELLKKELEKVTTEFKAAKSMFEEAKIGRQRNITNPLDDLIAKELSTDKLAAFKSKGIGGTFQMEYKSDGATMTNTDIGGRDAYFTWHQGGDIGLLPVRKPFVRELLTEVTTGTEFIKYNDQNTIVRTAGNVALCGSISTSSKVTFQVYNLQIQKVRDFTNVCLDMLTDYTFVSSQVDLLLKQSLSLKIDNNLLFGDGNSPNPNGIQKYASTFNPSNASPEANYAGLIPSASLIDLLSVAGAQIRAFGQDNMYNPNLIFMNPKDLQMLRYLKDGIQNYIKTPQLYSTLITTPSGNTYIDGMLIISNPNVAANTAWVMDSKKATIYSKPGVGIEFAYENGTNFENELVTVKIYERMNLLVRNVDQNAFMLISDLNAGINGINKTGTTPIGPS